MASRVTYPVEFPSFLGSCEAAPPPLPAAKTPGTDQLLRETQLFLGNQDLWLTGRFHRKKIDYPGRTGDVSLKEGATISLFGMSRYGAFAVRDDVVMKGVEAFLGLDIIGMSRKKRGLGNFLAGRVSETDRVRYLMPNLFGYGIPVGSPTPKLRESPVGRTLLEPVPIAELFQPSDREPSPMTVGLMEALERLTIAALYRPPPTHQVQGRADLFVDKQKWDANLRERRFLAFDFDFLLPGSQASYRRLPLTLLRSFLPENLRLSGVTDLDARYDPTEKVLHLRFTNLDGRLETPLSNGGKTTLTVSGGLEVKLRHPGKVEIRPQGLSYQIELTHPTYGALNHRAEIKGIVTLDTLAAQRRLAGTDLQLDGRAAWHQGGTRINLQPFRAILQFPAEGADLKAEVEADLLHLPGIGDPATIRLASEFSRPGSCTIRSEHRLLIANLPKHDPFRIAARLAARFAPSGSQVRGTFKAELPPIPLSSGYRLATTRLSGRVAFADPRRIRTSLDLSTVLKGRYSGPLRLSYAGRIGLGKTLRLIPEASRISIGPIRGDPDQPQLNWSANLAGPLQVPWNLRRGTYRGSAAGSGLRDGQLFVTLPGGPPRLVADQLELLLVGPGRLVRPGLVDGRNLRIRGAVDPDLVSILFPDKVGTITSAVWAGIDLAPALLPLDLEELAKMIGKGNRP